MRYICCSPTPLLNEGFSTKRNIKTIGGKNNNIQDVGTSTMKIDFGEINMTNVLYVLTLKKNLISIRVIMNIGNIIIFPPHIVEFKTIFVAKM
jgi:hypothetical protein